MKLNKTATIIFLTLYMLFVQVSFLKAQEQLRPLGANINLLNNTTKKTQTVIQKRPTTVVYMDTLPFFDDFSYAYKTPYPNANHWVDSSVYINTGFAVAPISLGVATFDGLNKKGYPYNISAPVSSSSQADFLTSQPINLYNKGAYIYSPADSIYLSFYFQAKGRGEAPEPNDSLCVDFFKPNQNKWEKVWGKKGYNPSIADTNFYMVMLAIKDTAYFDSLFSFRFRNKATLSGSLDHWNIDYVYLNKGRFIGDTIIEDLNFAYKPTSFLKNYSVMPYRQYLASEMGTSFRNYFRSNFTVNKFMNYEYKVYDKTNALILSQNLGAVGSPGVQPFKSNGYYSGMPHANPPLSSSLFSTPMTDSTFYKIEHVLSTTGDAVKQNDTVIHIQRFSNYYAYDDGSAEVGYYLNTYGAKTALRFTLNIADTLKAVNIYFDPIVEGQIIQASSFRVMVWADGNNGPGNVVYRDSLKYPTYLQEGFNVFPTYKLTSCLTLNPGTYYVGIQQTSNQPLNIGFDRNTNHMNALYYDIGSGWQPSGEKGSIMINPIMGCVDILPPVSVKEYEQKNVLSLHPNPAQNNLTIQSHLVLNENSVIEIYSAVGQKVLSTPFISDNSIDISLLPNGIYFVYLQNSTVQTSPKKLIIAR